VVRTICSKRLVKYRSLIESSCKCSVWFALTKRKLKRIEKPVEILDDFKHENGDKVPHICNKSRLPAEEDNNVAFKNVRCSQIESSDTSNANPTLGDSSLPSQAQYSTRRRGFNPIRDGSHFSFDNFARVLGKGDLTETELLLPSISSSAIMQKDLCWTICYLAGCTYVPSDGRISDLMRHVETFHKSQFVWSADLLAAFD
jgi:hypothetical protein